MDLETIRNTYRTHTPKAIGPYRYFSVLVPFVEKRGELHLLYEVRAKKMKAQPGEICFPGGHMEPGETPGECALRETQEEIGIPPGRVELIGQGNTMYGAANFSLYTFLGAVSYADYLNIHLQDAEVDHVFLVPVDRLLAMEPEIHTNRLEQVIDEDFPYAKIGIDHSYPWFTGKTDVPIYDLGDHVIWGITARITRDIMETLKGNR